VEQGRGKRWAVMQSHASASCEELPLWLSHVGYFCIYQSLDTSEGEFFYQGPPQGRGGSACNCRFSALHSQNMGTMSWRKVSGQHLGVCCRLHSMRHLTLFPLQVSPEAFLLHLCALFCSSMVSCLSLQDYLITWDWLFQLQVCVYFLRSQEIRLP
jgi:hypothetical protein